jgi:hypothetical protein
MRYRGALRPAQVGELLEMAPPTSITRIEGSVDVLLVSQPRPNKPLDDDPRAAITVRRPLEAANIPPRFKAGKANGVASKPCTIEQSAV